MYPLYQRRLAWTLIAVTVPAILAGVHTEHAFGRIMSGLNDPFDFFRCKAPVTAAFHAPDHFAGAAILGP
jgi:hypothetical protein